MNNIDETVGDKFELTALGKSYVVYSKMHNTGATFYEAHGELFEVIKLYPIDCDNPPCFAINGSTINNLSKAFTEAIVNHTM